MVLARVAVSGVTLRTTASCIDFARFIRRLASETKDSAVALNRGGAGGV